jgi:hypothetical protein
MYIHKYDRRSCAEIGSKSERVFAALAGGRGYTIRASSNEENRIKRVDFYLEKDKEIKGFDVKARKKICAADKKYADHWTWVEFKNADGYDGWMYGEANYIAFEKENHFLVVCTKSLRELAESLIDRSKEYVKSCGEAKYRIYQRRGQEEIALIKTSDIARLKRKAIWLKSN